MLHRVIVVGAGASGLMAAVRAAEQGASVTLLEATDRAGKKPSFAGGGRGNLAPANEIEACLTHHVPDSQFLRAGFIDGETQMAQLARKDNEMLLTLAAAMPLRVVGPGPLRTAMVTVGGVAISEVDPRTMASRRRDGLCFCDEMLDLVGDTGGHNLLMAFSSGWLAGDSAAASAQDLEVAAF
ncbi:MAG: NAD(P)/FAD-dependent oxidoreductase [Anaerolineae bacterium]|nr:NAD(P)/FAD-dependent oxidoreductase [Anaerolineae bacterium]